MPNILNEAEQRWARSMNAHAPQMLKVIKSAATKSAMVAGIAKVTGLSAAQVRNSLPIANWQRGVNGLTVASIRRGVNAAARDHRWSRGYVNAYRSGSGTTRKAPAKRKTGGKKKSPAKRKSAPKKRKTPAKKKSTSKKKSGGKRKPSKYNRFVKTYFRTHKNATMAQAASAWNRQKK